MSGLRDKMEMFSVAVFAREPHTNPIATMYVKAHDRPHAVAQTMETARAHFILAFEKITAEPAGWKVEEEFVCAPYNSPRLP
jgi:hypothetical protein